LEEAEEIANRSTAARTIAELKAEIETLRSIEARAEALLRSGADSKWEQLDSILNDPLMRDEHANRRKLIVFTESRDTLEYLAEKIRQRLGRAEAVAIIHGGVSREARRTAVESFTNDKEVLVLVANDAAGEGINLQRANLMVNYDLPWNPNRLEQRFGRIHRIGQTQVCHLWNLVAGKTREGAVFLRLLEKLEIARAAWADRFTMCWASCSTAARCAPCSWTPFATANAQKPKSSNSKPWTAPWGQPCKSCSGKAR